MIQQKKNKDKSFIIIIIIIEVTIWTGCLFLFIVEPVLWLRLQLVWFKDRDVTAEKKRAQKIYSFE